MGGHRDHETGIPTAQSPFLYWVSQDLPGRGWDHLESMATQGLVAPPRRDLVSHVSEGVAEVIIQHSSKSVEHFTPLPYVEAARKVMGWIDLDPASCDLAQGVIQAKQYYTEGGLEKPWYGKVFLNPPGGDAPKNTMGTKSNAVLWWRTLVDRWLAGQVEQAIFIGFTLEILSRAQGHSLPGPSLFPYCIPNHRIKYDYECDGKRVASKHPSHANVLVYVPPKNPEALTTFFDAFTPFGDVRL